MAEIITKSEFARRLGVKPAAVTNWIARQQLTSPGLRADGTIDFERARAQIRGSVDPVKSTGASHRVRSAAPQAPEKATQRTRASDQLLQARAISASVDAMRKRREFMAESGRYMLTADVTAAWTRSLTRLIMAVEQSFPDLAADLGLDHARQVILRRWWRQIRLRASEEASAAAEGEPEFIVDAELSTVGD